MNNYHDGGEAVLQAFRNLKVDYIISSPGSEWPSLWEALARQKRDGTPGPAYLDCGHETIAVTMACAYTQITGRMQAVLLHAGAGLLQGSMALNAVRAQEAPMLVMSGESTDFGEGKFDPGSQWYRNLSVVGGPQRLVEPLVKWAQQLAGPEALYEGVVRAGEMAQRVPKGPTYVCVPMETLSQPWMKPDVLRDLPRAPKLQPTASDIDRVAAMIAAAECPMIAVESGGADPEGFQALIDLAEVAGIPVVEGQGAFFGNFPKSHDLYLGGKMEPYLDEIDLALLIECRAPWYPPSKSPKKAEIVSIAEYPLKGHMVYQVMKANHYLEGDTTLTMRLLTEAVRKIGIDATKVSKRRSRWQAAHKERVAALRAAEVKAAEAATITVPHLMRTLREVMPSDTCYVDETIIHAGAIRDHIETDTPQTIFRAPSGLGQGLGYALGIKLAMPKRPVVMTIGDGTFMYNPVVPAIAFADEHKLPLLIIVMNNSKYSAMQFFHDQFYPEGTSGKTADYYGVHIKGPKYEQAASMVGGYGIRVENPKDLKAAVEAARKSLSEGKTAILNVVVPDGAKLR